MLFGVKAEIEDACAGCGVVALLGKVFIELLTKPSTCLASNKCADVLCGSIECLKLQLKEVQDE